MLIKLDEIAHFRFTTRNPTTGNLEDATAVNAFIHENATDSEMDGTDIAITKYGTGEYRVSVTAANLTGFLKGQTYIILVEATVGGVTDKAPIGQFQVSAENHGEAINATIADVPAAVWSYTEAISAGKTAFEVIVMAAAGAGAGLVSTGVGVGTTRDETFSFLDGSPGWITTADENGNRTSIDLNP